mmetsp:Transcript_144847/g.449636  ORF Transcript_144847/g.449636 Transcript_144847/m.449636 type:complete len:285 (-) Transcript_144847:423-1277(-)
MGPLSTTAGPARPAAPGPLSAPREAHEAESDVVPAAHDQLQCLLHGLRESCPAGQRLPQLRHELLRGQDVEDAVAAQGHEVVALLQLHGLHLGAGDHELAVFGLAPAVLVREVPQSAAQIQTAGPVELDATLHTETATHSLDALHLRRVLRLVVPREIYGFAALPAEHRAAVAAVGAEEPRAAACGQRRHQQHHHSRGADEVKGVGIALQRGPKAAVGDGEGPLESLGGIAALRKLPGDDAGQVLCREVRDLIAAMAVEDAEERCARNQAVDWTPGKRRRRCRA